jgi:hypothetical protein
VSWYPAPAPIGTCTGCGAGPHEFCHDDCPDTNRVDPRLTDCEDDR